MEYRITNIECRRRRDGFEAGEFDLEGRLVDFAVRIIPVAEGLPKTTSGVHVAGEINRSGTSPAPYYGEAQSEESRADFIHKMKIGLKELRETRVWLLIIVKAEMLVPATKLEPLLDENNHLISIFVKSIKTAKENQRKKREKRIANEERRTGITFCSLSQLRHVI